MSALTMATSTAFTGTAHTSCLTVIRQVNGNQVATSANDNTLKIWNSNTNTLVNTYYGHTGYITGLAVLPNGKLVSGSSDGTVRVWDTANNAVTVITTGWIDNMVWNPVTGKLVANGGGQLNVIDPTTLALTQLSTVGQGYYDIDVLLPSGLVITVGQRVDVWNSATGSRPFASVAPAGTINKVKLLPDNVTAVLGYANTGLLQLFNTATYTYGSQNYTCGNKTITMITLTPDLLYVITASYSNALTMWTWGTMVLAQEKTYTISSYINAAAMIGSVYAGSTKNVLFIHF
jgi:WD40 repeat protein